MLHVGDVTKIKGAEVPKVNVITFGAPCQDLSIAGKRAGMKNVIMGDKETTRSGLFFEAIRIIKEMREDDKRNGRADVAIRPRFAVYENVPGAFSSNKGEDFRAVLEETAKVAKGDASIPGPPGGKWPHAGCIVGDGWSIAWRVHDAQFWGVPQRRKRISLVADFGGDTAPEILFEREGVSGDTEESGKERERVAGDVKGSFGATGGAISFQERAGKPGGGKGILIQDEHTGALSTLNNQSVCYGVTTKGNGDAFLNKETHTSLSIGGGQAGQGYPAVCYGISSYDSNAMKSPNPHSGIYEADTSRTLDLNGGSPACNQGGMAVVTKQMSMADDGTAMSLCANDYKEPQMICIEGNGARESHKGNGYVESETMYTLNTVEQHAVAYRKQGHPQTAEQGQGWKETEVNDTLNAFDQGEGRTPTLVVDETKKVYDWHRQDTRMTELGDVCVTVSASWGAGGNNMPYVLNNQGGSQMDVSKDRTATLRAQMHGHPPAVVDEGFERQLEDFITAANKDAKHQQDLIQSDLGVARTLAPGTHASGSHLTKTLTTTSENAIVRRLTPLEAERLQGYPDHWTDIGEWVDSKGKTHKDADSPRYKALGNSIALPFWEWMAKRMVEKLKEEGVEEPTMASLFDGIGGFPLVYQRTGCKPVWASEIEEFPIAVTKLRFPKED